MGEHYKSKWCSSFPLNFEGLVVGSDDRITWIKVLLWLSSAQQLPIRIMFGLLLGFCPLEGNNSHQN